MKTTFEHRSLITAARLLVYIEDLLEDAMDDPMLPDHKRNPRNYYHFEHTIRDAKAKALLIRDELKLLIDEHFEDEEE